MNDHVMQWSNVAMPLERCQRKGLLWSPEPAMAWAPRSPSSLPVKFPSMRLSLLPGKFGQTPRNLFFVFLSDPKKSCVNCSSRLLRRMASPWWLKLTSQTLLQFKIFLTQRWKPFPRESMSWWTMLPMLPPFTGEQKPNYPGSPESSLTR